MKACLIQPPYSVDTSHADEYFDFKLKMLDQCDDSVDLIVLPEYSDVPCATSTREETLYYHKKYIQILLDKCKETALRCNALVFVNALSEIGENYRNTTYVFDQTGTLAGQYFKKHLPPSEQETLALDSDYTFEFSEPYVLELDGLRYGFLTCYDFYFYESFAAIARQNVDIIIGCSLQRSDTHEAIEIMCRFLAYNTNAYVLRSSVSFREDSDICGASMAVSPYGKVLVNMRGRFGMETATFDPRDKYYKQAGFGNLPAAHYEYIEYGRKPWQYRPAGSAVIKDEKHLEYPRICAMGGFNSMAPESSMAALGAAVALDVEEIGFYLWLTADRHLVSVSNEAFEKLSAEGGMAGEYSLEQLKQMDLDGEFSEKFRGFQITRFEEILRKFSAHVILNIHIESEMYDGTSGSEKVFEQIASLLRKYEAERYAYITMETEEQILRFRECVPDIPVCFKCADDRVGENIERAVQLKCEKLQMHKSYVNPAVIAKIHESGMCCNISGADDPAEIENFRKMGVDTILIKDGSLITCLQGPLQNELLSVKSMSLS